MKQPSAPVKPVKAAVPPPPKKVVEGPALWCPDWRWHLKTLAAIYVALIVAYFAISHFLSTVKEPFRMRDIPQEMTPWLKK